MRRRHSWWRRARRAAVAGAILVALAVLGSVGWVRHGAAGHVYDAESVPAAPVALVLGAQVYDNGTPSPFLAALDVLRDRDPVFLGPHEPGIDVALSR